MGPIRLPHAGHPPRRDQPPRRARQEAPGAPGARDRNLPLARGALLASVRRAHPADDDQLCRAGIPARARERRDQDDDLGVLDAV